ncbi:MAG: glycosyltransferase family 39 protein [Planctomycetes bacterium]|nr:glycosyltransferase family 39 protein [Planctomycetota bacterium]
MGRMLAEANRDRAIRFFVLARWACLPILFAGGWFVYSWAKQLYGARCGLVAVTLYAFSPNMLAYGASITPDMGAAAMGLIAAYAFWAWLRSPTLTKVILAGIVLGLAELTKTSWIILFGLWPCLWMIWRSANRAKSDSATESASARGLAAIMLIALYVLNLGYAFEGSFTRLGNYTFISEALSGRHHTEEAPDNRFKESLLARLPLSVPANYVRGIDVQRFDFEVGKWSYLRGRHKHGGWWWYYLYALAVKEPIGNLVLLGIVGVFSIQRTMRGGSWLDELVLLAPAIAVFLLVSSQTGFSRYMRYILPCMPFVYIWISKAGLSWDTASRVRKMCVLGCLVWSTVSSLWIVPHSMSYFNELAGGPRGGPMHLLDANIDWAQDFLYLKDWAREHPQAEPLGIALFGDRFCNPELAGLERRPVPHGLLEGAAPSSNDHGPRPGWYAISVNHVHGYRLLEHDQPLYAYFREFEPVATVGYSIYIYHITLDDANRVRRELGLPELSASSRRGSEGRE